MALSIAFFNLLIQSLQVTLLVLSEFTGASVLLNGAVLTNPYSHRRMDEAIEEAIYMNDSEQKERMEMMTSAVESYTVDPFDTTRPAPSDSYSATSRILNVDSISLANEPHYFGYITKGAKIVALF